MSNLGTIYKINLSQGTKYKYPIVYENKSMYYCKQAGTDYLLSFKKGSKYIGSEITLYSDFKSAYDRGQIADKQVYNIYVGPHDETQFDWINDLDTEIMKTKRCLGQRQNELFHIESRLASILEEKRRCETDIESMEARLVELLQRQEERSYD